jgi:uncharacterized coiled-coil DUF342 family protein
MAPAPMLVRGLFVLAACSQAAEVTPMEKVISLLKDLSAKVVAEGKKEAAEYDKYACFCKAQADEKLYNIETSDSKIANYKAKIKELETSIAALNSEIADLSKSITSLEDEIKKKTEKRESEHEEYLAKAKDMSEAIGACEAAITALKDSKKSMKGAKVDFAQVKAAARLLLGTVSHQSFLSATPGATALLAKLDDAAAPKYEYQSNDIIATLQELLATFKKMKNNLDVEEFDINSAFESDKLGLSNEKKFKEQDKAEKEAIVASKTETLETTKSDKDEEQKDRDADQSFLDELTKDCEAKALLFDQRSKTRADEVKALSEATEELQKGAVPNYSANKKLVGLQKKAPVVTKTKVAVSAVSFAQISSVDHTKSDRHTEIQKAVALVEDKAKHSGSAVLTSVVMRMKMAEDHFVKVRGLIKDLIAKLEADALSEATQKSTCDKGMAKAISDRDEAKANIEAAEGKITTYTANQQSLESEMKETQKQIAELKKALLEAEELRQTDKAENAKTLDMSKEAIESVKLALQILQDFYNKALLQTSKYVPPLSDREGNTVGDLAPEVFTADYHGAQSSSKGIIGILEVILSDFERTETKTTEEEQLSKEAFEMFEKDTNDEIAAKEKKVDGLEKQIADIKSDILDQEAALKDAKALLDSGLQALESLQAMCVQGEESWEERRKKRMEEIEALKDALAILEDWQK